jgi:hypothetical protein
MEAPMQSTLITLVLMAFLSVANAAAPASQSERKAERSGNKIHIKRRDANGNWKTEREIVLMFTINPKRPPKK